MASTPIRDTLGDHLLTPQNAALLVIDYQPSQFAAVRSMDPDLLLENIISTVKTAKAFGLPNHPFDRQCRVGAPTAHGVRSRGAAR